MERNRLPKQVAEDLQPWIQREKAEHIKRSVTMGKRGFERIEKLWDEREPLDSKQESFAAKAGSGVLLPYAASNAAPRKKSTQSAP